MSIVFTSDLSRHFIETNANSIRIMKPMYNYVAVVVASEYEKKEWNLTWKRMIIFSFSSAMNFTFWSWNFIGFYPMHYVHVKLHFSSQEKKINKLELVLKKEITSIVNWLLATLLALRFQNRFSSEFRSLNRWVLCFMLCFSISIVLVLKTYCSIAEEIFKYFVYYFMVAAFVVWFHALMHNN